MLLALLALVYNELNDKFHWGKKELSVPTFALIDYILVLVAGLILSIWL